MRFGLPNETLAQIIACVGSFSEINWVKIYGSRAMGNYRRGSDIDLAFSGNFDESAHLLEALDGLSTPYLYNVTYYESIGNQALKDHIDRVGVIIYTHVHS